MTIREKMLRAMTSCIHVDREASGISGADDIFLVGFEDAADAILAAMRSPECAFGLYVVAGDALRGQSLAASQERAFAVEKAWQAMFDAIGTG